MSNITLIPAMRCKSDELPYYLCTMKCGELVRRLEPSLELGDSAGRLKKLDHPFIDCLPADNRNLPGRPLVAVLGGDAVYVPMEVDLRGGLLQDFRPDFGVLSLDGSLGLFALDGQEVVNAIKNRVRRNPHRRKDDVSVLVLGPQLAKRLGAVVPPAAIDVAANDKSVPV